MVKCSTELLVMGVVIVTHRGLIGRQQVGALREVGKEVAKEGGITLKEVVMERIENLKKKDAKRRGKEEAETSEESSRAWRVEERNTAAISITIIHQILSPLVFHHVVDTCLVTRAHFHGLPQTYLKSQQSPTHQQPWV